LKSDLSRILAFLKKQPQGSQQHGQADIFACKTFENPFQEGFINLIKDGLLTLPHRQE